MTVAKKESFHMCMSLKWIITLSVALGDDSIGLVGFAPDFSSVYILFVASAEGFLLKSGPCFSKLHTEVCL